MVLDQRATSLKLFSTLMSPLDEQAALSYIKQPEPQVQMHWILPACEL
jgi:hypothetical protein